jgi:serine/threonine-protein kinase
MSKSHADLNLLFGILALQMDFISRDQLIAAMNAWALDKGKSLGTVLVEQKVLEAGRQALLQALVEEHLKQHDDDPEKSLAAVTPLGSLRQDLEQIADPDVHATLVSLTQAEDPLATCTFSAGAPTSAALRFRILRPHAKGGLGQVYVAEDEELHREVALKEIQERHADHPESRSRFLLEAEITGRLEHPGIVPVYGLGQYSDGRPFYAMRFIKGDSLKEAIERFHQAERETPSAKGEAPSVLSASHVLEFRKLLGRFIDVCNAIQYAHDRGILHRDLKPGNVMLGKYGETLVVDWGLAKPVGRPEVAGPLDEFTLRPTSASGSAETQAGSAVGTPQYMSPEQAAGRLDLLAPSSDVYSLGATLYCLLTGRAPFEGNDLGMILQKVQRGDFPRPSQVKAGVPRALEAICLKAMVRQAGDRYASPRALADDIEHFLADEPVRAWREPWTARLGRWMRRHKPLVTSAAVLLLAAALALAIGIVLLGREQTRTDLARQQAREHFRRSRDVVDRMLVHFADSPDGLRDVPGMATLRRQIIDEALAYYRDFLNTELADPDVRQEAGRAFMLVGRVRRQDGKYAEAEQAFLRAKELFAGLSDEFPASVSYRLDLARCRTRLGMLYQGLKRVDAAREEYGAAVALCAQLAAAAPDDLEPRFQLASARNSLGIALRESGDIDAAEAEYHKAREVAQEVANHPGATPEQRSAIAHIRNNLANLYAFRTRWADALAELAAARDQYGKLVVELPRVAEYRASLAATEANRINPLLGLGRTADALKAADASLALRQKLADDFPDVPGYQADLAAAHYGRGVVLRDCGRLDEAEQPMQVGADGWGKLAHDLPDLAEHRRLRIVALSALANLRDRLGRPKEAEASLRAALDAARRLAADFKSVRPYRARLANECNTLGSFLINHSRAAEAEAPLEEAIQILDRLTKEAPADADQHNTLGMALGNRSVLYRQRDDLTGARRALDRAVVCHDRALNLIPKHTGYRKGAARELTRLTDVALQQGDHVAGVAAAEKRLHLDDDRPDALFTIACACSRAIVAAEKDGALPEARRKQLGRAYADRAVACLREAKQQRPLMIIAIGAAQDLAPLRARVDLKAALADSPSPGKKDRP